MICGLDSWSITSIVSLQIILFVLYTSCLTFSIILLMLSIFHSKELAVLIVPGVCFMSLFVFFLLSSCYICYYRS